MARVAFIGLGTMGYRMAGHLAHAGHDVRVFNRTTAMATRWATEHRGEVAETPAAAAAGARFVFTCVGADDDVRSVTTAHDGALATMERGSVLIDHTTTSAELAREVASAAAGRGVKFLDAPVSGGQAGAQNGTLSVMCGGSAETVALAEPVMQAYARVITHQGPTGNGQLTKMVNQILCAAAIQGAAEAIAFAERAGLDLNMVFAAVTKGAANSWYLENRGATMIRDEFEFGFAVDWMRKDLRLCLAEAASIGATLPNATIVEDELRRMQERGGNRLDATSIIRLFRGETA